MAPQPTHCPYCYRRVTGGRAGLRVHVAANTCGQVPEHVAVAVTPDEARDMSEAELQGLVQKLADELGYRWAHVRRARSGTRTLTPTSGSPGFPDLWIVGHGRLVVLEVKSHASRARRQPGQDEWLAELAAVRHIHAQAVAPGDWPEVQQLLTLPR